MIPIWHLHLKIWHISLHLMNYCMALQHRKNFPYGNIIVSIWEWIVQIYVAIIKKCKLFLWITKYQFEIILTLLLERFYYYRFAWLCIVIFNEQKYLMLHLLNINGNNQYIKYQNKWKDIRREHKFMTSTQKVGWGFLKFVTSLQILLFLNKSIIHFCR